MPPIDARGKLEAEPFSYAVRKDGLVCLEFHGRVVKTLSGREAERFLERISGRVGKEAQLVLAKLTGHFKHGNER
ncbi:MAG: hypothetical protein HC933_07020 [Pleurocapsa sp. SU_196_0]|nr:hypothetical protein [Pleurocapsa sp. SU_196_0]